MTVLIDTDIRSEFFRGKDPVVRDRASEYRREHWVLRISTITEVEIARGWHHVGRPDRAEEFRAWLVGCEVL